MNSLTHWADCWKSGPEHYECAIAEVERLREDADRYKWLRDNRLHSMWHPNGDAWGMSEVIYGDDLEAAIDAARGES